METAVEMRAEGDAGFGNRASGGQRHDLETARIGEDRIGPVHEAMQPAECRDALGAGAQH